VVGVITAPPLLPQVYQSRSTLHLSHIHLKRYELIADICITAKPIF